MGSSKTAQALMTKFNYEEKGGLVWLIKPAIDTRDNITDASGNTHTIISSRIGLQSAAQAIEETDNILDLFRNKKEKFTAIICDECQFLSSAQVEELKYIANELNIPVFCFGLRTDFQTKLFPGSLRLFEIADSISEIKSICKCGNKAIINARINEAGNVITSGEQVCIGGNEKYIGMCYSCYKKACGKEN